MSHLDVSRTEEQRSVSLEGNMTFIQQPEFQRKFRYSLALQAALAVLCVSVLRAA